LSNQDVEVLKWEPITANFITTLIIK